CSCLEVCVPSIVLLNEFGDANAETTSRIQSLLSVESCAFFTSNWKIVDENLRPGVLQLGCHVDRFGPVLVVDVERLPHVRGYAVQDRAGFDCDAHIGDIADFRGGGWVCEYGLAEIASELFPFDLEGCGERDIF